ncbi:MAG: DNA polymerase III subunit alpha [Planctomycetota bacterium]|nr:MAG: DNA polymerase III subunit alpha [Planctomycetota bacterium]
MPIESTSPALAWPLALRTWHGVLEGACSAADWAQALGETRPSALLLADRDTLAGLPQAIAAWGRERVIPGVTLRCSEDLESAEDDVLLLPRSAAGYAALCRFLSWRNERPRAWESWLRGGRAPQLFEVVALLHSSQALARLQASGAELWWWQRDLDDSVPPGLPTLALALLDHRHGRDRAGAVIRAAVAQREGRLWAAAQGLDQLRDPGPGWEALVSRGHQLLAAAYRPAQRVWQMPPSPYGDAAAELRRRAEIGLARRYTVVDAALRARFEHELAVIIRKGFAGYLLTVDDIARGRRTCGRGSGASSLIVYCLGITNVDPQRYQLVFERFLNNAREDPPDLDVDFPWDERDAVLAEAMRRFGADRVAMVANHCYLRRGSALRVAARAYGQRDGDTTRIRNHLRAQHRYGRQAQLPEPWPGILDAAAALEGRPHHQGLHCGGVIITPGPIRDLVPVHPAAKRIALDTGEPCPLPVIDWEKDGAEDMGLVKIDLLGNRALAVVRDCLADLHADGITIDEDRWRPAEDPQTQELVARGDSIGCFYIESPAMRQLQARAGSGAFDALVIHSSIIRPAANRWINIYLERLHDFRRHRIHRDAWYPHPSLRQLLSESFGVLSYQEDIMQVAVHMAGFSETQANALRKALGHWDTGSRLTRHEREFREGAAAKGAKQGAIDAVWEMISSFAGYSFCKAHSASYAMLSFQCAWLKAHFPAYFLARVIANEGGFYQPAAYLEDARRRGIEIRGPCLVHSDWASLREGAGAIRCGLHLLPGISAALAQRLLHQRRQHRWRGLDDLRCRGRLPAQTLDTWARAGALDALCPGLHRGQVLWLARCLGLRPLPGLEHADQQRLPGLDATPVDPTVPELPQPSFRSCVQAQLAILGFAPPCHPLALNEAPLMAQPCAEITPAWSGRRVSVYAQVITRKQVSARSADGIQPMAFVTVEDASGILETVWFSEAYRRHGPRLEQQQALLLQGQVQVEYGFCTLVVDEVS